MKQLLVTLALLGTMATRIWGADTVAKPNIIVILADDLGFGDTGCYGATKIPTPNIDQLGREGLRFTDAHATSATCTPSRYALLTGQYPWRRPGTGVLSGNAALIINPEHATLPSILRGAGYRTGIVGKWHLGLGGPGGPDWNGDIRPGPLEVGFDYAFIQPATGDRVPCVYVEDHHVAGLDPKDPIRVSYDKPFPNEPTGRKNPELVTMHTKKGDKGHSGTILDGIARIGYMTGGRAAYWKDATKAEVLTAKAVNFIAQNSNGPFFLEFAAHDPHVPRVPAPQFVGKSGCGVRGDVIVEFDWSVGQILDTLRQLHLTTNTLVILTSDNGPVIQDGYDDGAQMNLNGHTPAGPLRGGKYSVYEGGTRVPFLVSWPGRVSPGVSDALVSLVDFTASFAALTGQTIPAGDAPDSRNLLAALLGETRKGRDTLVEHDGMSMLGFRDGQWKLIQPGAARRYDSEGELYDLAHDLGETNNLQPIRPEMNGKLAGELKAETNQGRAK